ncbi:MAG TPA: DUF1285 domain-containing protein [Dongiaceae bacterium]|nr:DUF1285 domain-containing protein [Dongiaceae bacterium]
MNTELDELARLAAQVENRQHSAGLPPVDKWNPAFTGDLDMRIARDGGWFYLGTPILRQPLVRLFSTILKREGDDYFLVTPVEKFRIRVEDAPFVAVGLAQREQDGVSLLEFETSVGDHVVVDAEHPIRVHINAATGEPSPYVRVRANLDARIGRAVFYQLVDLGQEEQIDGTQQLCVRSAGQRFVLGEL